MEAGLAPRRKSDIEAAAAKKREVEEAKKEKKKRAKATKDAAEREAAKKIAAMLDMRSLQEKEAIDRMHKTPSQESDDEQLVQAGESIRLSMWFKPRI